ncbi:MAG: hypothetical protein ACK44N_10880 [Bacteroidota bacterium]|jgi:hypothetical protein
MKKQILTLIMMLSIMNTLPTNAEATNQTKTCVRPPKIHIVIVMGKPKYDCEVYPGICVFLYGTIDRTNPLSAGSYASYENNTLQIEIMKNEISETLNKKLQEDSTFDLENEYEIPDDMSRDLGSETNIILSPGSYEIQDNGDSYLMNIHCR